MPWILSHKVLLPTNRRAVLLASKIYRVLSGRNSPSRIYSNPSHPIFYINYTRASLNILYPGSQKPVVLLKLMLAVGVSPQITTFDTSRREFQPSPGFQERSTPICVEYSWVPLWISDFPVANHQHALFVQSVHCSIFYTFPNSHLRLRRHSHSLTLHSPAFTRTSQFSSTWGFGQLSTSLNSIPSSITSRQSSFMAQQTTTIPRQPNVSTSTSQRMHITQPTIRMSTLR